MFDFLWRSDKCPVEETRRQWLDRSFAWLLNAFELDHIRNKKILVPHESTFPFQFVGDEENAYEVIDLIAPQMDLDPEDIDIEFYDEGPTEIATGGAFQPRMFLKQVEGVKYSAGHYLGKNDAGKYQLGIEKKHLKKPEQMVATLAHELAHVKLLGEERIKKNNESLTDMLTVVFGLGIFGANCAFQYRSSFDSWGYSKLGYLRQMDWGYILALLAHIREENTPDWINFLTLNVKHDFLQSERFIIKNREKIFSKPEV